MSLSQRIAKHTAIQAGGKVVGVVLSLFAAGLMLRYLGEEGNGKYGGVFSFLQIFGIMMDLGLYIILIKKIARITDKTASLVNNVFTLRLVSGLFFLSLAPIIAWIIGHYEEFYDAEIVSAIALSAFFFLFISLNQLLSAIFQKKLQTGWIALGELLGKIALLASMIVAVWLEASFIWIMATFVVSAGINFLVNFIASQRYFRIRLAFDFDVWKSVLKEAWPIGVSIGFSLLYFKGDTVLLTFWESKALVGQYTAPYRGLEVLVTFPAMFTGLVLPVVTAAWQERDTERFQRLAQKAFDGMAVFAIPMVAGTLALAPLMMQVLAGDGYELSDSILRILVIATGAIYFATLFGYIVPAIDKQRAMMWGYMAVAVSALAGYIYVIPRYSVFGAAWVTVYSEIAVMLIAMWLVMHTTGFRLALGRLLKLFVGAGIMYAALMFLQPWWFVDASTVNTLGAIGQLIVLVPLGAAIYAVSLMLLGAFSVQEVKELVQLRRNS